MRFTLQLCADKKRMTFDVSLLRRLLLPLSLLFRFHLNPLKVKCARRGRTGKTTITGGNYDKEDAGDGTYGLTSLSEKTRKSNVIAKGTLSPQLILRQSGTKPGGQK